MMQTIRYSRWLDLTRATAFSPNAALQPRALIMLGTLLTNSELATHGVVQKLIVLLSGTLSSLDESEDLAVATLMAMASIVPNLEDDLHPMFWLAASLLHVGSVAVFAATLALLETCVKTADSRNCFENSSLEEYFLEWRQKGPMLGLLQALDRFMTVSFETNFSFAFCGPLLKGLKSTRTRAATVSLLSTMLDIGGNLRPENLGYLAALLPYKTMLEKVGNREGRAQFLWTRELIPSPAVASLLLQVWVALLKPGKGFETETQQLYTLLHEGLRFEPNLTAVQAELLPYMREVVQLGKDQTIIAVVFQILETVSQTKTKALQGQTKSKEWNFSFLRDRFAVADAALVASIRSIIAEYDKVL
jgi:hypothetical protein